MPRAFWERRVGYSTRRGCLVWIIVLLALLAIGALINWQFYEFS